MVAKLDPPALRLPDLEDARHTKRVRTHTQRASEYFLQEQYDAALGEFEKAHEFEPDDSRLTEAYAVTLGRLGRHAEALKELDRALALKPNDPHILWNRTVALYHLRRFPEAHASIEHALALRPEEPDFRRVQGLYLFALGRLDEAHAAVKQALALAPNDEDAKKLRREILDAYLWRMVERGEASWSGGKPKGSKRPVKLTPGPPVSDYIVEERNRLRG